MIPVCIGEALLRDLSASVIYFIVLEPAPGPVPPVGPVAGAG
jgi:hypothetical protein